MVYDGLMPVLRADTALPKQHSLAGIILRGVDAINGAAFKIVSNLLFGLLVFFRNCRMANNFGLRNAQGGQCQYMVGTDKCSCGNNQIPFFNDFARGSDVVAPISRFEDVYLLRFP